MFAHKKILIALNKVESSRWGLAMPGLIAAVGITLIIHSSSARGHGFITPDSGNYLRLVANLNNGWGFLIPNDGRGALGRSLFATWPVGYPTAVHLVGRALELGPYWASKTLNIGTFLCCIFAIIKIFGQSGRILSATLLIGSSLDLHFHTWSEPLFLCIILNIAALTGHAIDKRGRVRNAHLMLISILALCAFMTRYIGLYCCIAFAPLVFLSSRSGRKIDTLKTVLAALTTLSIAVSYLVYNQVETGHFTGTARHPSTESNSALLQQLLVAVLRELVLPVTNWSPHSKTHLAIILPYLALLAWMARSAVRSRQEKSTPHLGYPLSQLTLTILSLAHLGSTIALRWTREFDAFDFRLLLPGSLPLLLIGFSKALRRQSPLALPALAILAYSCMISITNNARLNLLQESTYSEAEKYRWAQYSKIPAGSIVVLGSPYLRYMRPDIHIAEPRKTRFEYDPKGQEEWGAFLNSLDSSTAIFIETPANKLKPSQWSRSVRKAVNSYPPRTLISLGPPFVRMQQSGNNRDLPE